MRAAVFTGFRGSQSLEIHELSDPEPAEGEVVVAVEMAALNRRDVWKIEGKSTLGKGDLPYVGGGDLSGRVSSVADDGSTISEGDRVVLCPLQTCGTCRFCREGPENMCKHYSSYDGAFSEQAVVNANRLIKLPESVSFDQAAALPIAYMTAFRMLRRAETVPGDLIFIPGATGGVGVAAVQLADLMGAVTIGTSRSSEKIRQVEKVGLDHGIVTEDPEEMRKSVEEIGEVDVTINHLSGPYTRVGIEVLRRGGVMVTCGRSAGQFPEFDIRDLYMNHKQLVGSTLGTQTDLERLVNLVGDGELDPLIHRVYNLEKTRQAFQDMQSRDMVGKLLIRLVE